MGLGLGLGFPSIKDLLLQPTSPPQQFHGVYMYCTQRYTTHIIRKISDGGSESHQPLKPGNYFIPLSFFFGAFFLAAKQLLYQPPTLALFYRAVYSPGFAKTSRARAPARLPTHNGLKIF